MPIPQYLQVFGALLVLTVITVGVSYLGLPAPFSILVALAVAIVKAALVAGFFMHLKYDDRFNSLVLVSSVVFLSLFFIFTLVDLETRGTLMKEQDSHAWAKENTWQTKMADEAAPEPPPLAPDPMLLIQKAPPTP
jgi:caa(3)-type oxidase subunit IV